MVAPAGKGDRNWGRVQYKTIFSMTRVNSRLVHYYIFQATDSVMSMNGPLQRPVTPGQRKAQEMAMGSQYAG